MITGELVGKWLLLKRSISFDKATDEPRGRLGGKFPFFAILTNLRLCSGGFTLSFSRNIALVMTLPALSSFNCCSSSTIGWFSS